MSRAGILAISVSMLCIASMAHGQSFAWQQLSSTDAAQVVQTFESNPNLTVTVTSAPSSIPSTPDPDMGVHYVLTSGRYQYTVSAYTPRQIIRTNPTFSADPTTFYGGSYVPSALSQQEMSQTTAASIAQAFMQTHFANPQLLSGPIVFHDTAPQASLSDPVFIKSYSFEYYQDCGNGIRGPAFCLIEVDTIKGEVVYYASTYFPTLISTSSILTPSQAAAATMNSMHIPDGQFDGLMGTAISKPDANGVEHLYYTLTVTGTGPSLDNPSVLVQWPTIYAINVDANTGTVYYWDILQGLTALSKGNQRKTNLHKAQLKNPPSLHRSKTHSRNLKHKI